MHKNIVYYISSFFILALITSNSSAAILLYSNEEEPIFLGCMNCSEYDPNSVHNEYGNYGSQFSQTSINNEFSKYGSPYSLNSACNANATNPPIIIDEDGGFYGLLSLNTYLLDTNKDPNILGWLKYKICS